MWEWGDGYGRISKIKIKDTIRETIRSNRLAETKEGRANVLPKGRNRKEGVTGPKEV